MKDERKFFSFPACSPLCFILCCLINYLANTMHWEHSLMYFVSTIYWLYSIIYV